MKTQNIRLLAYLKAHKKIDPMAALTELGMSRLAARVYDLRKDGVDIQSVPKRTVNRYGESIIVSEYRLTKR